MDADRLDHLKVAWEAVVSFIEAKTSTMSRGETAEYHNYVALLLGCSERTFRRWREGGLPRDILSEKRKSAVARIEEIYRFVSKVEDSNWRVAIALGGALNLPGGEFGSLGRYKGTFKFFRLGVTGLIEGTVRVDNHNGVEPWMHYHSSIQDGSVYDHQGPIFYVNGRIYMVGIGESQTEKYFRPMIFKAQDRPHEHATFGILMTELADGFFTPLAAKVALVSENDPRLHDERYLQTIEERLKIPSDRNVIYGSGDMQI